MDRFLLKAPSFGGKRKPDTPCSSSSSAKKPSVIKGEQMYLDIGQKFGATKHCPKCGMLLVISDIEDNKRHVKFCKEMNNLPVIPTLKGHQIRATFEDATEHIIEVKSDHKLHSKQIQGILQLVATELGSTDEFISDEKAVYLYVKKLTIVGCLVTDDISLSVAVPLTSAEDVSRLHSSMVSSASFRTTNAATTSLSLSTNTENEVNNQVPDARVGGTKASDRDSSGGGTLGVRLIWVLSQCRRSGVATRLVDCARQHHRYGSVVSRDRTAFSQPTQEGFDFALRYCKTDSVLAY